jgi:hypothetical protein
MILSRELVSRVKRMVQMFQRVSLALSILLCLSCALTASCFTGCGNRGDGPERAVVSGTVTYNGKPIPEGMVRFVPLQTSTAPVSGTSIVDGKYQCDAHGGVPVGTYTIQIEATHKVPFAPKQGERTPPLMAERSVDRQYLPNRFNRDSQLQITIEPGSRKIAKDFQMTD